MEKLYTLILLGPLGVGKTHLAVVLGLDAIYQEYKVTFTAMGGLIHFLNMEDISVKSQTRMK